MNSSQTSMAKFCTSLKSASLSYQCTMLANAIATQKF